MVGLECIDMNYRMYCAIQNYGDILEDSGFKMIWPKTFDLSLFLNLTDLRDRFKNELDSESISNFEKIFIRGKKDAVDLIISKSPFYEDYAEGVITDPGRVIESFFKYISVTYYEAKRSYEREDKFYDSLRLLAKCAELHQVFKDISKFYLDGR